MAEPAVGLIPRQRTRPDWRQPKTHPVWCANQPHDRWTAHRSQVFTAGYQPAGGAVRVWLRQEPDGHVRVGVNASYLTGLEVEISVADARKLSEGLVLLCDLV